MKDIKNFIREQLRLVLENVISEAEFSSHSDVNNVKELINQLQKTYGSDEYFLDMSPTGGQGTVDIYIDKHGRVTTQRSDRAANINRRATDFSKENPSSLRFMGIPVGRGIEHPDTYSNKTRQALTIGGNTVEQDGSPASDAAIKAYLAYPEEIISLVNKNREDYNAYVDDKEGAQARADQYGDNYTQKKQSDKLKSNLEKELNKVGVTFDINKYFGDELSYTKSKASSPKIRMALSRIQNDIITIKNLVKANHKRERIQKAIEDMKQPILYNKKLRGVPDEFLQK